MDKTNMFHKMNMFLLSPLFADVPIAKEIIRVSDMGLILSVPALHCDLCHLNRNSLLASRERTELICVIVVNCFSPSKVDVLLLSLGNYVRCYLTC